MTVGGKFAVDLIARAAHAVALRAAALDHEAGDDAVENEAVIKARICQRDEVVDGVGGQLGIELAGHHRTALHLDGHNGIGHIVLLVSRRGAFGFLFHEQADAVLAEILQ